MNSTKSAFLKRHQNRMMKKPEGTDLIKQIIIDNWGSLDSSRIGLEVSDFIDEATQIPDAIYKALGGKETVYLDDISIEEIKRSEWEFIRAYHLIEITIAIAVGVYLWLK